MLLPSRILIATGNAHKAGEIRALLAPVLPFIELVTLADVGLDPIPDAVECYDDFMGNAKAKAVWCQERSGLPSLADDSGLCVDALDGRPGVRSARWAGPSDADRNAALLVELERTKALLPYQRAARFVCYAAYAPSHGGPCITASGEIEGSILSSTVGAHGFGYDPLFYISSIRMTLAEADEALKNRLSHRGKAMRALGAMIFDAERLAGN